MPLDPGIILSQQPIRPFDLAGALNDASINQVRRAQAAQAQQEMVEGQATDQAVAQSGGDLDKAAAMLSSAGHGREAMALQTAAAKQREAAQTAFGKHLENQKASFGIISTLANSITDQSSQDAVMNLLAPEGKQVAAQLLGPTYDPARVKKAQDLLLTAKDRSDLQHQTLTDWLASKKESRDDIVALGNYLSTAGNPQEAATILAMAPKLGISPDVVAMFQGKTPEQAGQMAMSAKDRAELADKTADNARQEAQNAIANKLKAQEVGLSAARLGLERQKFTADQKAAASGVTAGKPLTGPEAEKVAGAEQTIKILGELKDLKNDAWIGPAAGRVSELKASLPGVAVDPKLAKFMAQTATLKNSVIKQITGAQMSEKEADRILGQVPLITDKPEVWKQKYEATLENAKYMRKRMLELTGHSAGDQPSTEGPKEGETKPIPGYPGTEQTFKNGKWIRTK